PRISAPASMIIHLQAWMRVLSTPVRRKKHMEGDFSRITFNKSNQYSRVLMQQGRVLVDADWNEQAEIMNGALRALITDLVGSHWGMVDGDMAIDAQNNAIKLTNLSSDSFKIGQLLKKDNTPALNDFSINGGHYYVDGLLCVNEQVIG